VHTLKLAERGGVPGGWILEIVARQPDLLSRAGKGAEEGNKPGVGRLRHSVPCKAFFRRAFAILWSTCCSGARFGSRVAHGCSGSAAGSLGKANELVVDEAISDVVELVNVLHCLTLNLSFTKCWIKASVPMGTPRPM
jgi:hypothetical protein